RVGLVKWTFYDPLRRVIAVRDPLGRTTTQQWCTCGSLDAFIDANGQKTSWQHDLQARITREVRADGLTATSYTYAAKTSRLMTVTDPKGQVTTYSYNPDDTVQSMVYMNATIATPNISYAYDTNYKRPTSMTDGIGTTAYTYKPVGVLGALQIASVSG